MVIAPKFDESTKFLPREVVDNYQGAVELQMLNSNLLQSWDSCKQVLSLLPQTDYFVLHTPFPFQDLCTWAQVNAPCDVRLLMRRVTAYCGKKGIRAGILFHSCIDPRLYAVYGEESLAVELASIGGDVVDVIIENAIGSMNHKDVTVPSSIHFLRQVPECVGCIDICHLMATENFTHIVPQFKKEDCERVHYFHCSAALNNDGWRDKSTHGRLHPDYFLACRDLDYMRKLGFDIHNSIIVAEINETDYYGRPDMVHELRYLWGYQRKVERGG